MKLKNFAMITEEKVTEIFCIADDFCKVYDAQMAKYTFKAERKRKYHRESRMSKAEIMVIMVLFHSSGYRCLKHFYLEKVCKHMRHLFPEVVSYNRWSSESRSQTCLDYAESRQRKTIVNTAFSLCPHSCFSDAVKCCGERAVWCRNLSCWQRLIRF